MLIGTQGVKKSYFLPPAAMNFVRRFDSEGAKAVKPFRFRISKEKRLLVVVPL